MAYDEIFDEVMEGPKSVQISFLEKYIQENMNELRFYPDYLEELKDLILLIKATDNVIDFPSMQ